MSEADWRARKIRHPVGVILTAEVSDAFASDGSYLVRYEGGWSVVEGAGAPPAVGSRAEYQVVRHLDMTRRTLLRPAGT